MTISFSYAIKKLLSGQALAWEKFEEAKAGKITLGEPGQRRLFAFLLSQDADKVAEGAESLFPGLIAAWTAGHRGLRLSSRIVDKLLVTYGGALFATTDDKYMKSTLGNRGFKRYSVEWKGVRGLLSLWLRVQSA